MRTSDYSFLSRRISIISALVLTIFILIALISCSGPMSDEPVGQSVSKPGFTPTIQELYPTTARPYGKSLAEWAVAWTKWVVCMPPDANPIWDTAPFDKNQSGNVVFLCGAMQGGTYERNITIKPNKSLFFPLLNIFGWFVPTDDVDWYMDYFQNHYPEGKSFTCSLDGEDLENLDDYLFLTTGFSIDLPSPNLFDSEPARTVTTGVTCGYYLMLHPLSRGNHTLHFVATDEMYNSTLDVTYNITVTN